jgi:predicted N-acetyltransferase YhbS
MIELVPLAEMDGQAIEVLLDRAFGADRRQRTAYRVRAGATPIPPLSFAALEGGALVGSIQCWPVALHAGAGEPYPLIMLGPVAVSPERQKSGIGQLLTARAIEEADALYPDEPLVLIGDPEYYGRFFGFSAQATAAWQVPGPVERHRLLARPGAPAVPGLLGPRLRVAA